MNPFLRKLSQAAVLSAADQALLEGLSRHTQRAEARADIVAAGEPARSVCLILQGWACRYHLLETASARSSPSTCPGTSASPSAPSRAWPPIRWLR